MLSFLWLFIMCWSVRTASSAPPVRAKSPPQKKIKVKQVQPQSFMIFLVIAHAIMCKQSIKFSVLIFDTIHHVRWSQRFQKQEQLGDTKLEIIRVSLPSSPGPSDRHSIFTCSFCWINLSHTWDKLFTVMHNAMDYSVYQALSVSSGMCAVGKTRQEFEV